MFKNFLTKAKIIEVKVLMVRHIEWLQLDVTRTTGEIIFELRMSLVKAVVVFHSEEFS
jgi:hypothetical protein